MNHMSMLIIVKPYTTEYPIKHNVVHYMSTAVTHYMSTAVTHYMSTAGLTVHAHPQQLFP